jgi:hypothetical protein
MENYPTIGRARSARAGLYIQRLKQPKPNLYEALLRSRFTKQPGSYRAISQITSTHTPTVIDISLNTRRALTALRSAALVVSRLSVNSRLREESTPLYYRRPLPPTPSLRKLSAPIASNGSISARSAFD